MTPEQFIALQEQVKTLTEVVTSSAKASTGTSKNVMQLIETIGQHRALHNYICCAISAALAKTRILTGQRQLEEFNKMWQIARGPLGSGEGVGRNKDRHTKREIPKCSLQRSAEISFDQPIRQRTRMAIASL